VDPITQVLRVRVLFRTDPAAEPHVVAMTQDGDEFVATLPKPTVSLARVHYRVEAQDPELKESTTDEVAVPVQGACADPAPARKKAQAAVTPPAGGPPVPAGFDADQVQAEDAVPGTGRAGVLKIGPWASLAAAVAVGGAAVAVAAAQDKQGNPPPRDRQMETPGITFVESSPAPGSTVRSSEIIRIVVRAVPPTTLTGATSVELRRTPDGPACLTLPASFVTLEANFGRNIAVNAQPLPSGACGSTFEVTAVRVQFVEFGSGRVLFGTGTTDFPDLALRYTFTP
jgi:hypothetical protein